MGDRRDRSDRRPSRRRGAPSGNGRRSSRGRATRPRKPWTPDSGQLPKWVADQLARVTPKGNLRAATDELMAAATHFSRSKYGKALESARRAKGLAPRDATIREILALSAYRLGQWDLALRELRTFRRFTGEATHMPVEMDVLRALDRPDDVRGVWLELKGLKDVGRDTRREAQVVYGSFLLDVGDARGAWEVTNPQRVSKDPEESEMRVWFVACRAAARLGDDQTARQLFEAIEGVDPSFPGLDQLGRELRND